VFTHCLFCQSPFPEHGALEHLGVGERIAFDPDLGRLWIVCRRCGRWTLAPIEERWEALEELEHLTAGGQPGARSARLLSRSDNVELFESGPLTIIRVGRTERLEEAWWRYGQRLQKRSGGFVEASVIVGAGIVGGALSLSPRGDPTLRSPAGVRRWLRFGDTAWRGHKTCSACGYVFTRLPFSDGRILILWPGEEEESALSLSRRCPQCKDGHRGGLHLQAIDGEWTLRRVLAYEHHIGSSLERIRGAMTLIERAGRPSHLARLLTRHGRHLGDFPETASIAMEIAANEAAERRLLTLEVSALRRYWREAEDLASIVDGELTPTGPLDRLRRGAVRRL
jgi:ribosomal protein L37E